MVEKMPDRSVLFGDAVVEITDPLRVQPASADALVEFRYTDGILCLSFATYVIDGSGPPTLTVCSRLRIALPGAMHLRDALNSAIADIIPGKDKAN